jgi:hypothetical protein
MRPQSPEDRLREALRARADEVEPSPDALPRIRERTARTWHRGLRSMVAAAAAVAAAIAIGAVAVATARHDGDRHPPAQPSPTQVSGSPDTLPDTVPDTSTANLPAYFTRNGRLYREFLPATPRDDRGRIQAAVELSLAGRSADPDYRSLWPTSVRVRGVAIDGTEVTVDLADVGAAPQDATLAVQQLVYTVLAAATYTSLKHATGVRLLVDGSPVSRLWGRVDTGGLLRQGALADFQAPVWVIEPNQGAVVGKTFTAYIAGIVWEGTVNLRFRDAAGAVVDERVIQLSVGAPSLGDARTQVTLPSGRYTVEAYFISQKDSSVQWVDDHDFTVG